jgi:hypothetical protein
MKDSNHVGALHSALGHAAYQGFDQYTYQDRDWTAYRNGNTDAMVTKTRKHTDYDLTIVAMFPQTWGSTTLGFGGIGGAAMTTAYTIVVESDLTGQYCVYFGGQFAYRIDHPNEQFFLDLQQSRMHQRDGAKTRYERTK